MRRRPHILFVGLFTAFAMACDQTPTNNLPTAPTVKAPSMGKPTPEYELGAAMAGRIERGTEDDILRMETYLPGLGGI